MNAHGWSRARFGGIPAYFNEATNEIRGRNWLCDMLLNVVLWLAELGAFGFMEEWAIQVSNEALTPREIRRLTE